MVNLYGSELEGTSLELPPEFKPSAPYPGENRPLVLKFVSSERPSMAQIIISVVTSNKNLNITLDNLKDLSMAVNSQSLPTFHILGEPTYSKYKIDSNPAISYTFVYGMSEKTKELYVGSKINSTIFHIGDGSRRTAYTTFILCPLLKK